MWINEEVDVMARHVTGIHHPLVQAIRWRDRRIDMRGAGRVERKTIGLDYTCTDGVDRYFLHHAPKSGRWVLLSIDDFGLAEPGGLAESDRLVESGEMPRPRVFPRPDWT